ncbi:MAG: HAD family hydrolase, partial [Candidatus Avispirillum sp.]
MAKYELVIWDFNGTVIDDTQISIDSINTVLGRRTLPQLSGKAAFQDIFTFPVEEYYCRLGFDFSKEPYSVPADEWVELYNAKKFQA